ncbi:hypothetical protein FN846DRAFT_959394 [Sphaerosporella brunnea]|uniref:Heme oxygenase n=1 Tax=Sphaerosporella brunnea TaxID=1250544 RepID=A0A5J5EQS1_9PEZI|nr:hypothetical protein FN846DRAFT_959394 [Sphaerosporella brunnea]
MSTAAEEKRPLNLAQAINVATKDLHDSVNRLVVQRLALGLEDYRLYREGIKSFYYVYLAFERTWAKLLSNPATVPPHVYEILQAISNPQLSRASAIASDLTYLYGPEVFDPAAPPDRPVRCEVADYIEKTLSEKPHLVLAYTHNFYMALFAGGKILLRQMLTRKDFFPIRRPASTYDEAQAFSTNFFVFPVENGKEDGLRQKYRDAMAHVEGNLSEEETTEIIQESRNIYQINLRLVQELDEICGSLAIPPAQPPVGLPGHGGPVAKLRNLLALLVAFVIAVFCLRLLA